MDQLQTELQQTLKHLYADMLDFPILSLHSNSIPLSPPTTLLNPESRIAPTITMQSFEESIRHCQNCAFYLGRKNLVFGKGQMGARVAFIGDLPSLEDDNASLPFTGETGELLHKMILAMQLKPSEVYFTNLLKCRAPANKIPTRVELQACEKHLQKQMEFVKPEMIVAFGEIAAKALARSEAPLAVLRKQEFDWFDSKVMCTHHPRDLLINPNKKKETWDDLKLVMKKLGLA